MRKQIYTRRQFLRLMGAGAAVTAFGFPAIVRARPRTGSVIVLGIDGMDPTLLDRFVRAGRMPNARRLMEMGGFSRLGTSDPPQSPVAWSNFISGTNPGGHGIFDFIARDPATLKPYLSTSAAEGSARVLPVGDWRIPLKAGKVENLRRGATFWVDLGKAGVPCTVLRMPANFPPTDSEALTLSGLGTPDIHGSYGLFSLFTNDRKETTRDVSGGHIDKVFIKNHTIECRLRGPINSFRADGRDEYAPFTVHIDPVNPLVRITVQGSPFILKEGEWSEWIRVAFPLMPLAGEVSTICRFHLKSARNPFSLYVSPLNMDPESPALPISTPPDYARDLARRIGPFYTQGMPPDTSALSVGVFDDRLYREQATFVLREEQKMFESELGRFSGGFFFSYFCSLDLNSHTFWRTIDPQHPAYTPELEKAQGDFIPWLYEQMDKVIGLGLERMDRDTLLMVCSDHGFGPFRRQFQLNSWLMDNGYAAPLRPLLRGRESYFADVKWSATKAYGLGINSLYLNLRGREPNGCVAPGASARTLENDLIARLTALRDPATGEAVIARVSRPADIYSGPCTADAPDLIIGYNHAYRASWDTILGKYPKGEHILDNTEPWSGDHAMDSTLMPGVLLASRPITHQGPALSDMAPTILRAFDVRTPDTMTGKAVLEG